MKALAELRPNHQRLLTLREIEGLSCESIAEAEGTSPESVAAALYRARRRLRDAYNRVAAGAMAGLALVPARYLRRRAGVLSQVSNQMAVATPAVTARAGEVLATVVALAVVTVGAPTSSSTDHRDSAASQATTSAESQRSASEAARAAALAGDAGKTGAAAAVDGRPA